MTRAPRRCLLCNGEIEQPRPVYLIQDGTGEIHGPLHPSCAATAAKAGQRVWNLIKRSTSKMGSTYARQEPLPCDGEPGTGASR